jgi:hypothetical protein
MRALILRNTTVKRGKYASRTTKEKQNNGFEKWSTLAIESRTRKKGYSFIAPLIHLFTLTYEWGNTAYGHAHEYANDDVEARFKSVCGI